MTYIRGDSDDGGLFANGLYGGIAHACVIHITTMDV